MGLLTKHISGSSQADKADRADLLEKHFGTRSQTKIENLSYEELKTGYNLLHIALEGKPVVSDRPLVDEARSVF